MSVCLKVCVGVWMDGGRRFIFFDTTAHILALLQSLLKLIYSERNDESKRCRETKTIQQFAVENQLFEKKTLPK